MKTHTIGIIGYGKLGSVLTETVSKEQLLWVVERNQIRRKSVIPRINVYPQISDSLPIPEIIILSVNDSAIESVSNEIAKIFGKNLKDVWVLHCSGVLPVSVLLHCKKHGAKTACIHPFQTFYYPDVSVLKNIGWTIETKHDPEFLQSFIKQLKGKPILLPIESKQKKILHHLSAVFASNFLSSVLAGAGSLEELAGMNWKDFLPSIIETTINNNYKSLVNSEKIPLTGPIARADIETIKLHLKTLGNHASLFNTYIYLSLAALETAKQYKIVNKQKFAEIKEILLSSLND